MTEFAYGKAVTIICSYAPNGTSENPTIWEPLAGLHCGRGAVSGLVSNWP